MTVLTPSTLTARVVRKTLGDHFLDFLNANNPDGYEPDLDQELTMGTVGGILMLSALEPSLAVTTVKRRVKMLVKVSGKRLKYQRGLNLMALALGYIDWGHACCHTRLGMVPNRRISVPKANTQIFKAVKKVKGFYRVGDEEARRIHVQQVRREKAALARKKGRLTLKRTTKETSHGTEA